MEKFNIVIVGHVDHGKSTLTGRILFDTKSLPEGRMEEIIATCKGLGREFEFAYILDALLEEREGALTIDTTQVTFRTAKREYIIIDTPGHKEFLKNMITGTSYAEAAVLMVSAQDGIQEQTRRHAYILKLFGIRQIIVAINKMDEIAYSRERFLSIKNELNSLFDNFGMKVFCTIPICAKNGDNLVSLSTSMPWYQGQTLLEALDSCKKTVCRHDFRMPVQDIYCIDGVNVAVGRICSGEIRRNDAIVIMPDSREAKVFSLRIFESEQENALAGENIGLVINDDNALKRGDILSSNSLPNISKKFLALAICLKNKLLIDTPYILQCVTQQISCKIEKIEEQVNITTLERTCGDVLNEADIGKIRIVTDIPLVYEEFDILSELGRFVLRKDADIVGAGIII